jgi:hypothetical protein
MLVAAFAVNWLMFGETSPASEYFLWHVGLPNAWRGLNLIPGIIAAIAAGNLQAETNSFFTSCLRSNGCWLVSCFRSSYSE